MKLRIITSATYLEDFDPCNTIYENDMCDMLYYDRERAEAEKDSGEPQDNSKDNYFFSQEDLERILEEMKMTIEKFEKYFDDQYGRLYVFEDDNHRIIGFIELYKISGYRWKLANLCVDEAWQSEEVISQILDDLMKQKGIKQIDVCTFVKAVQDRFFACGYEPTNPKYLWYFRRTKQKPR